MFFNLVLCFLFILLGNSAHAARLPLIKSTKFDCNSLYSVSDGVGNPLGNTGTIFKIDLVNGQRTTMYSLNHLGSTIALGHKGGRSSGGPLVMYSWSYGGQGSRKLWTVESGATDNGETSTMFDFRGPAPFGYAGTDMAGGEVNQMTGEIYMTNVAGSNLNLANTGNFRLGIFNPVTGANRVGIPKPLTKGDTVEGPVGSDMAIDAEGNAYIIVQDNQHGPVHKVLIKVMPTTNSGYWPYVIVQHLRELPGSDVWGMAFVDGHLYTSHADYHIWRSNPLTGVSQRLHGYDSHNVVDLSSCQVAPIIKGKVYFDPVGAGNVDDFNGTVPNIQVELWKDGSLITTHHTSEAGEFNFIVDSIDNQDYYVRIVRPEVNGIRAKQSWAAAKIATNSVTAYCGGSDRTKPTPMTESGPCVGANPYDPSSITSVDKSYIYSLVNMRTDDIVADASIALTTVSNYGDAPSSYHHATKPAQHLAIGAQDKLDESVNLLRLGETVTVQSGPKPREDANAIASHDGVEVSEKKRENFISLQDAILIPGKAYTFRVKATGRNSQKAYLNAWVDWSQNQKEGKFGKTRFGLADMLTQRNDYVKFDYQVPSGSATGLHDTYARFRVSTTKGLGPNNDTLPDSTETIPWAVDGEVEDYRLYIATGEIKLSAISIGKLGKFNYEMSNVVEGYPSSKYDSIQTMSEDNPTYSSVAHAYASVGKPIVITQSFDDNLSNWTAVSAECYDENDKLITGTIFENGKLTIPGKLVKEGGLSCQFNNSYGLSVELIKKISGERANKADQFTVQIKDGANVVASSTTTDSASTATTDQVMLKPGTYTLTEVMAAGSKSKLSRYRTSVDCENENAQSMTKLPLGNGNSFTLTPDYGDKITCTLTNTAILPDLTKSIIFANPSEIIANDGEEDGIATITVQLRDSSGQNITEGGDKIEIYFSDSVNHVGSIIDGTEAVDNGDGTYSIKVKSSLGGSDTFSYKVNGQESSNTVTLKYKPGKPDLTQSTITAVPATIFADNTEQSVITVQLKDRVGNDLTFGGKYVVTLVGKEPTIGQVNPSNYTMQNNGDGTFTAYVKSAVTGEDTFGFKIDSELATQESKVIYKAGVADPNTSDISVDRKEITADGSEVSTVTVTLKDSLGNLLLSSTDPKTNVAYNVVILPKNKPAVTDIDVVTNNNGDGTFTAKITSTKAGTDIFGFTVDGVQGKPEAQITYLPGLPDLKQSTITANPSSITADGSAKSDIIIQLKDKFGNDITAQSGKVMLTDVNIATQSSSSMEAEYVSGKYKYSLSSTKTGIDDKISFTLDGTKSENTTSLEYLPGSADLTQSTISVSPDTIVADGTEEATVTVQLRDAKGNKLTNSAGFVDLIFNDGNGRIGNIDSLTKIKDNGDGTYTATVKSTKAGSDKIGFMLNSITSTNTTNLVYKPGKVDLTVSTIVANPTTIEANNTEVSVITVQLKDRYGNNLETNEGQILVELNTNEMIGKVSNNGVFKYQGAGRYEIEVTSIKAGSDTFTYSLDGKGTGQQSVTVNYKTGGVSLTKSTITTEKNKIIADNSDETTIIVQLKDQFENNIKAPMGEQERVFLVNLDKGYPSLGVGQFELAYIGNGRYEANIKSKIAGIDNIGYKVGQSERDALVGSNKVEVTYVPGPVDFEKSTIVAHPSSIIANGQTSSTVTVQLKDAFNNLITEDQGKISLVGLTLGELKNNTGYLVYQDGSYVGYVTSTKKGNDADIRFTLNNQGTSQEKTSITYTPDRVNLAKSTIVASKPEIIADYSDVSVITIQFKDSYGNNLDGEVEGVVSLVDLNHGEIKTALKSIGNGAYQAEIYSKVADADDIGFTLDGHRGGQGTTGIARVVYHPGEADLATSTIEAQPDVIVANNVTTAKIHVQLRDKFGNKLITAPNDEIKIFIANTNGAIGSLTDFTNYNNGTYSALVKSSKTGKDLIDFSINGVASGKPTSVTYIAGSADAAQSLISATPAIIVADDNSVSTVTVQLRDANGNNLTNSIGNAVSIGIVGNSPVNGTTISQVNDNNDGTYSITVKSKRTGVDLFGFYVLGVKSGNTTDVTYIPGNADLAHSTITAIPSTIVADGVEQTKITVQLKDKFNNNLDTDAGLVKLTNVLIAEAGNITLNYDGQQSGSYSGYLTSTKDGSDTISFELNGSAAINQSTTVVYKSGGVSLSRSTITATPDTIIADDTQTSEIIIQLKDQYGNDTYNNENVVLVGIEKGKLVTFGPVSDQKGKFKATIKSTKVGLDTIGFKVDNVESANNVAVTYRPGEPSLNRSTITVTPSEIIADNGMTKATVTVYLKDKFDNDLDSPINETVSLDSNSLVIGLSDSLTMSYAGDNVYKTTVYSKQVGTDTLKYKIGTNTGTNSALITYIPGPVSLTTSEITATPDEVIANGTDSSTIVVQLKDQNGNNLTTNLGTVSLFGLGDGVSIDLPMTYRGNGRYEGKIVSSKTGKHLIGYTISNIGDGTNKANVTFKPGPVSMTESVIISEPNTIVANGQATSTITIQLKDAKGNNLDTDQGKISLIGLNYGKIAQDMTYVGEGRYEGKITSTRANKDTIGFQLDNQQSNNTTTVTYTAGEVDLTKSVITADPTDILANNKDESLITVQLKDSYGNDIGIKAGEVMLEGLVIGKIKGNAGSIKLQYQGEGKYTGSIISNLSGTDNIGFNLDGETANGPETNVSINYHPGPVDIDVSTIDISPKKILADGKAQSTITIELKDKDGNHQAKNIGVIEILGIVTGIEPKDVKNVTYIGNGVYQTTVTSTNVGSDTISYRLTETSTNKVHNSSQKVTIEYIAGAVDPSKSTIEIDKTSIKADGVEQAIVTVSLRDQYNHLIPGSSNEVMLILKGDGVGEFTPMTNTGNGIYQFTVNSTVTGTDNFEYRYFEGQGWLNGDGNVSVTYKPGAIDVTKSSIEVEPPAIISDNLDKATITVTLRDSHNNLITTPNTQVKLDVSGDKIGETPVAITPNNDGIFKFTVTSTKPGKDIFSYQFNENDSWLSGQNNVEVEYLISDKFDQTASSIEAEPAQIVADGLQTSTITVKLFYESNPTQPLAGLGDRLEVVGKDGQVGQVKFVNETNGVYTFSVSSTSLGKDEFIFKTSKSTSQQSAAVDYIAGDAFDEAKSTIKANPSQIVADGADTSTITVELYYPNSDVPLAGLGDRLEVVGKDGQVGQVKFVNETNGVYTFSVSSTSLGKDEFIFKTSKSTSQQSAAVDYIAGDAFDEAKSTIKANPSQIVADGADTSTITVELYYPNSDVPLAGLGDRLEVVGKDGQVGQVKFVNETNGVYTF
ncbi:Ig-like domain-containing protein, partial [Candidatus Schmidhempelia bombi]|uniref:Ig-like domain-containing protein n=1 Tax=Candidatus Schmidhempelia bombi TaxID=1505866 RepID=UPI001416F31F